jgi:hypothetical protein
MKDIKINDLAGEQAVVAQVVIEDALEQLGFTWDYTETSPDMSTVIIKNVRQNGIHQK